MHVTLLATWSETNFFFEAPEINNLLSIPAILNARVMLKRQAVLM